TDNKKIVKEFIDRLFTEDDVSVLGELAASEYVDHDPPFGGTGTVDGWRAMATMIRDAFPDWHSDLHALYAEGDIVVERLAASGLDVAAFQAEALRRLRSMITIDAAFFATVDPETLLFTSASSEEPLVEAASLFLDNEFGRDDVNKFASLAGAADPVSSLDV